MKDTHEKVPLSVARVIALMGSPPGSRDEAAANAVEAAARTLRNIRGLR